MTATTITYGAYLNRLNRSFRPGDEWHPLNKNGVFDLDNIDVVDTWEAMVKLLDTGKVRSVGVSSELSLGFFSKSSPPS
jgi:hypothetical protein